MEKSRKGSLISWIIMGVLGVLLIAFRDTFKDILYIIMGVGLILAGLSTVVGWWRDPAHRRAELASLLGGLVMLAAGIWIVCNPATFDSLINIAIGISLIVTGIQWLSRGWRLGRSKLLMTIGIIPLILGIVIFFSRSFGTSWPIILEGIGLIYAAVSGVVAEWKFRK